MGKEKPELKECERLMHRDGAETEVHVNSVKTMESLGWVLVKGQKAVPSDANAPANTPGAAVSSTPQRSEEEQAKRDAEDEGAHEADAAQLREALDGLKIAYPTNAKKAALIKIWLARP